MSEPLVCALLLHEVAATDLPFGSRRGGLDDKNLQSPGGLRSASIRPGHIGVYTLFWAPRQNDTNKRRLR